MPPKSTSSKKSTPALKMDDLKNLIPGQKKKKGMVDEMGDLACSCCKMTRMQRLYAFGGCYLIGWLLGVVSALNWMGPHVDVQLFGFTYTAANITLLASTMFLMGPRTQCRRMFDKTRRGATCLFLAFLLTTIIYVFSQPKDKVNGGIVLLLVVCQWSAGVWYAASYIPYGRSCLTKGVKKMFS